MPLTVPVPLPRNEDENTVEDKRLWIGNLDSRITEFQLLKILQQYGPIEKFDLLFHKSGQLAGQPRGYGFVTYKKKQDAASMKADLHGKKLGMKCVAVKWAYSMDKAEKENPKAAIAIPALSFKPERKMSSSRDHQIKAIETKLKLMEQLSSEEFQITDAPSTSSFSVIHNQRRNEAPTHQTRIQRHKPYFRK